MGAHTSSDDPTRYRLDSELQTWNAKDPITRYRAWLEQQGIIDDGVVAAVADAAESAAQAMRARLIALPPPPPGEAIFGRVYSKPPESFLQERADFEASLEDS
jgi:pyruvate dehydrogenase E1 component alpha subunit